MASPFPTSPIEPRTLLDLLHGADQLFLADATLDVNFFPPSGWNLNDCAYNSFRGGVTRDDAQKFVLLGQVASLPCRSDGQWILRLVEPDWTAQGWPRACFDKEWKRQLSILWELEMLNDVDDKQDHLNPDIVPCATLSELLVRLSPNTLYPDRLPESSYSAKGVNTLLDGFPFAEGSTVVVEMSLHTSIRAFSRNDETRASNEYAAKAIHIAPAVPAAAEVHTVD
ncbi:hypothetical protein C8F01DRAFT_1244428 [Mycena amicta]|nr:hypothetical protein C8F01DRAFT_1244428 [Mycena amicta]